MSSVTEEMLSTLMEEVRITRENTEKILEELKERPRSVESHATLRPTVTSTPTGRAVGHRH